MQSIFDHQYYYFLYTGYLNSLISKCKCEKYDPLNSNGSDILDEVAAYLKKCLIEKDGNRMYIDELIQKFKNAAELFRQRYIDKTGYAPGNLYLSLIDLY